MFHGSILETPAAQFIDVAIQSPESAYVLEDNKLGWFGQTGVTDIMQVANAPNQSSMKFEDMFVCDPSAKHHGYKSWDGMCTFSATKS